ARYLQAEVIGLHLELAAKQHREQIRTLANRRPVPLSRQEHVAGLARVAHDRLFGYIGHPGGLCERRDEALNHHSLLMRIHGVPSTGRNDGSRGLAGCFSLYASYFSVE